MKHAILVLILVLAGIVAAQPFPAPKEQCAICLCTFYEGGKNSCQCAPTNCMGWKAPDAGAPTTGAPDAGQ